MNCIEALAHQLRKCEPCKLNSFIIEFDELPEDQRVNFDFYDKSEHFLLHCKLCDTYKILPDALEEIKPLL